jgi:hypothetical protein
MRARPGRWLDLGVYSCSAIAAVASAESALRPIRLWGRIALPVYGGAAAATLVLALWRHNPTIRTRTTILGSVLLGALVLPLTIEIWLRQTSGPHWAQAEVLVVEQGARAWIHGVNPYGHVYLADSLSTRQLADKHFPYLPGMLGFGVPRALWASPLADARIAFAIFTLVVVARALARSGWTPTRRLRVAQILLATPFGALALSTGGDDLPVLALLLCTTVALAQGRSTLAWSAILAASFIKASAWPVLIALIVTGQLSWPRRAGRVVLPTLVIAAAALLLLPGVLRDAVLYPLGLTGRSSAAMPTVGRYLLDSIGARGGAVAAHVVVPCAIALAGLAWVFVARAALPRTLPGALLAAALLMLLLIVFSGAARPGYFAYPVNLVCWAWIIQGGTEWRELTGQIRSGARPVARSGPACR